ncbi:hypothetical protein EJB05_28685, partial [Eragrostis curvula]
RNAAVSSALRIEAVSRARPKRSKREATTTAVRRPDPATKATATSSSRRPLPPACFSPEEAAKVTRYKKYMWACSFVKAIITAIRHPMVRPFRMLNVEKRVHCVRLQHEETQPMRLQSYPAFIN